MRRLVSRAVSLALLALALCTTVCTGGCAAHVKPWQREDLARRPMVNDLEPGEERFRQHATGAREGADGGTGAAGGGCGCN